MIISCPACSARYRVAEEKIQGRGARITCPTCAHKFVVYRGDGKLVVGEFEGRGGVPVTIARKGELHRQAPTLDEEEAPTTLMPHGSTTGMGGASSTGGSGYPGYGGSADRRADTGGMHGDAYASGGHAATPAPSPYLGRGGGGPTHAPPAEPATTNRGPILLAVVAILVGAGMLALAMM